MTIPLLRGFLRAEPTALLYCPPPHPDLTPGTVFTAAVVHLLPPPYRNAHQHTANNRQHSAPSTHRLFHPSIAHMHACHLHPYLPASAVLLVGIRRARTRYLSSDIYLYDAPVAPPVAKDDAA